MDWVIDTDVLARADCGDDCHDHCINVLQLLGTMRASGHVLVVDHELKVIEEYRRNLRPTGVVQKFLKKFADDGKIQYKSGRLVDRMSRKLRRMRFDADDDVFVAVAHGSSSGRLVAEESDYTDSVIDYLASQSVRVINCVTALAENIERYPLTRCPSYWSVASRKDRWCISLFVAVRKFLPEGEDD